MLVVDGAVLVDRVDGHRSAGVPYPHLGCPRSRFWLSSWVSLRWLVLAVHLLLLAPFEHAHFSRWAEDDARMSARWPASQQR